MLSFDLLLVDDLRYVIFLFLATIHDNLEVMMIETG